MADRAPLYSAPGVFAPAGGEAFWIQTRDGKRLRTAYWPAGRRGTVLLYPGRTEFIEKHYEPIGKLAEMGFSVSCVDWRGQGLSTRALDDRRKGHVGDFTEFQRDVDAWMAFLKQRRAPEPWVVVAHSMGGAIAARSLMRQASPQSNKDYGGALKHPYKCAVFTSPMLGIEGAGGRRTAAVAARAYAAFGWLEAYVPGPKSKSMTELGFQDNGLTTDRERFENFARMIRAHDDLALGAATWGWLLAARRETRLLRPTQLPTLVFLGDGDQIVSSTAIKSYVSRAPDAELVMLEGAWHEPFMETDAIQAKIWPKMQAFFKQQGV